MCGIAGVAFLGTLEHEQEVLRQKLAWYIITELLITTQARGDDATGIATIFNDGNYIGLKMGVMASEFVARKGGKETDYDGFLNVWKKAIEGPKNKYAKLCMAHCRKTTLGSVYDNDNNHPIHVEPIIGVHNGTLTNHDTIFEMLNRKRIGNVDSEAIFSLLHEFTDGGKKEFTVNNVLEVTKRLHGTHAVVAANGNSPNQVVIFRDGRPLLLNIIKPLSMIIMSSEEPLFQTALYRYNKEVALYDPLYGLNRNWPIITKNDIESVILKDDHLSIIDLTDALPENFDVDTIIPQVAIPRGNKIWEKKTYTSVVHHDAYWNNRKTATGAGATGVTGIATGKPAHTEVYTKKEESKNKSKVAGFVWVEDADAYKEITEEQITELEKIGSVEVKIDDTSVVIKEVATKELTLVEIVTDVHEPLGNKEIVVQEIIVEPAGLFGENKTNDNSKEQNPEVISVDLWKNPDYLKKSAVYVSTLPMVETETEVAEIIGLSSVEDIKNLPLVALVNKIRKVAAKDAYYDACIAAANTKPEIIPNTGIVVENNKKRDTLVGSAKNLVLSLTTAIGSYNENLVSRKTVGSINNFITKSIVEADKKSYVEDISSLFTDWDLSTNNVLREVYTLLPSRTKDE